MNVFRVICSADEIATTYADTCRAISEYWDVPAANMQFVKNELDNSKVPASCNAAPSIISVKSGISFKNPEEYKASKTIEQKNEYHDSKIVGPGLNSVEQPRIIDKKNHEMANNDGFIKNELEAADESLLLLKDEHRASGNTRHAVHKVSSVMNRMASEQLANGSVSTGTSYSNGLEYSTCGSLNENVIFREDAGGSAYSVKNNSLGPYSESGYGSQTNGEKCRVISCKSSIKLASFKPQAYVNQYIHGGVAASAAAYLADLTSEEGKVSESLVAPNSKKTVVANIALQMKAFSLAALNFIWPSHEKKLMEVPRERCGWCIACKGAATNKKGCFLNLAASNAIKGSARNISSLRSLKPDGSHIPSVAAYIANMEESLHGLIVGPLLDVEYKQWWRKQVRDATSCRVLTILLLEVSFHNVLSTIFESAFLTACCKMMVLLLCSNWCLDFCLDHRLLIKKDMFDWH